MDFYKKVEIFEVRSPGSNAKPLSILIKLVMCIAIWSSGIVIIATSGKRAGLGTNIHRCTMDFYKKVEIFEVRGPGSHTKPLSILTKLGMFIAMWPSYIVIIATCLHTRWLWGSRQIYIDVQWISIRK